MFGHPAKGQHREILLTVTVHSLHRKENLHFIKQVILLFILDKPYSFCNSRASTVIRTFTLYNLKKQKAPYDQAVKASAFTLQ